MICHMHTDDSPKRPGYEPQNGDQVWTLLFPLSNGDDLHLSIGKKTHDSFISMLQQETIEDTIDEVMSHGASGH